MWRVTGVGARTSAEYVYRVDAPADARKWDVIMSAAKAHGDNIESGVMDETLISMDAQYS